MKFDAFLWLFVLLLIIVCIVKSCDSVEPKYRNQKVYRFECKEGDIYIYVPVDSWGYAYTKSGLRSHQPPPCPYEYMGIVGKIGGKP